MSSDNTGRTALLTLSRWRYGFESRWGCQKIEGSGVVRVHASLPRRRAPEVAVLSGGTSMSLTIVVVAMTLRGVRVAAEWWR